MTRSDSSFDAVDFAIYLRGRWRVIALCCASALLLAGGIGAILPKRYTATATLIIQPPASMDPRAALAVSPVYLESLKTYESFATSDTLFSRALDELGLREKYARNGTASLKRQVLAVSKPAATRIIEIKVTLGDPVGAKRLARFIAEQTAALNRSLEEVSSDKAIRDAEQNLAAAEVRLRDATIAGSAVKGSQTVDALTADLKIAEDLKYDAQRELARSRTELADLLSQRGTFPPGDEKADWNARETTATRARVQDLIDREKILVAAVGEKAALLEHARPVRDSLDTEQRQARTDLEAARTRLSDLKASSAFRGERLEVLDPGIVPERPSYPNTPLILLVAFATSLLLSLGYLAAAFGYGRAMSVRAERVYHMR
jgi:uncharacterized protein involved in exopolysaccharide biosynthesis